MSGDSKVRAFRSLHERGCFVLPNPWDRGTAKWLEQAGYAALATTSAGLAFSLGRPDHPTSLGRDLVLENVREIVDATRLPVNADFQSCFGRTPAEVAESVRMCVDTGVAGLSIEDATGDPDQPLFALDEALARLEAALEAVRASGTDVVVTARAECYLVGHAEPLRASIERLTAYAAAGADCLYAPGPTHEASIEEIVAAVAPLPVNVLARASGPSRASLEALGARRVSIGSAMARVAWRAFIASSFDVLDHGRFDSLAEAVPFATLDDAFSN